MIELLTKKLVIQTDADFTPPGKRTVQLVRHSKAGKRIAHQIRWYVGNKAYRTLPLTNENIAMSEDWKTSV